MGGGFPVVATHPFLQFQPTDVVVGPEDQAAGGPVERRWSGQLARDEQRVSFIEKVRVHADNRFTLKFDCEALTDLDIRMGRHYVTFPVPLYAGAKASATGKTISLPESLGETDLLSSSKQFTVDAEAAKISVESTLPLALVDHRRYGTEEYLLAGYPVWNAVKPRVRRGANRVLVNWRTRPVNPSMVSELSASDTRSRHGVASSSTYEPSGDKAARIARSRSFGGGDAGSRLAAG